MNSGKIPMRETVFLAIGEIVVSVLTVAVYLILQKFNYTVVTGVLLGSAVSVLNFIILSISVNRALDNILVGADLPSVSAEESISDSATDEDTSGTDDAAARFARENQLKLQNAIKLSYFIRTATMVLALIVAFVTKKFDLIATLVPLFMFRPILTVSEMLKRKES